MSWICVESYRPQFVPTSFAHFGFCHHVRHANGLRWIIFPRSCRRLSVLIGDIVKITEGPFAGRLARLASTARQRVLIEVEVQGRELTIEMDADWIVATAPERKSVGGIEALRIQGRRKPLA